MYAQNMNAQTFSSSNMHQECDASGKPMQGSEMQMCEENSNAGAEYMSDQIVAPSEMHDVQFIDYGQNADGTQFIPNGNGNPNQMAQFQSTDSKTGSSQKNLEQQMQGNAYPYQMQMPAGGNYYQMNPMMAGMQNGAYMTPGTQAQVSQMPVMIESDKGQSGANKKMSGGQTTFQAMPMQMPSMGYYCPMGMTMPNVMGTQNNAPQQSYYSQS